MNSFLKFSFNSTFKIFGKCDSLSFFSKGKTLLNNTSSFIRFQFFESKKSFSLHAPRMKRSESHEIRRDVLSIRKRDNIVEGENSQIDLTIKRDIFPTFDLPEKLFDGVPFKNIPVVYVKATKRNTILSLSDNGFIKQIHSCGRQGFKNAKKGTGVAAQATGTSFGIKAVKKGFKNIKVVVKGLGNGRLSALKGLQISGLNIISITDNTKDIMTQRPKKQRRL